MSGCLKWVAVSFVGFLIVGAIVGGITQVIERITNSDKEEQEEAELRDSGYHCLLIMSWNLEYSHYGMNQLIKNTMGRPDSFEMVHTQVSPVDERGNHYISVIFRGRPTYGPRGLYSAYGTVDNETCRAELNGIEWMRDE